MAYFEPPPPPRARASLTACDRALPAASDNFLAYSRSKLKINHQWRTSSTSQSLAL